MKDKDDEEGGTSVDSSEHQDEPVEDMAWDFHALQDSGHWCSPALPAIWDHYTKYNVEEPADLVGPEAIIEDRICYTPSVFQLTHHLAETKEI